MTVPRTKTVSRRIILALAGAIGLLVSICLSDVSDKNDASSVVTPPSKKLTGSQEDATIQGARSIVGGSFATSLEMKENVDFLLTPALLVQEAVSNGVVITYPSE